MRIQHNIAALNSYNKLNSNQSAVSKNLEKLSSGYRINRAGDDAAGLAISEKMRAQITGLKTAQKNANDGISLVQTAEGALTEVHSMLNRMTELATQSANGTYDNETDRANLQKEVQSLKSEIDRISDGTNYNGINLLDGSLGGGGSIAAKAVKIDNATTTESAAVKGKYTAGAAIAGTIAKEEKDGSSFVYSVSYKDNADGATKTMELSLTLKTKDDGTKVLVGGSGKEYGINDFKTDGVVATDIDKALATELAKSPLADKFTMTTGSGNPFAFEAKEVGSEGAAIVGISEVLTTNAGKVTKTAATLTTVSPVDSYKELVAGGITAYDGTNPNDAIFSVNGQKFVLADVTTSKIDVSRLDKNVTVLDGTVFTAPHADVIGQKTGLTVGFAGGKLTFKPGTGVTGTGGLDLQIGDTAENFNKLTVSVGNMSSKGLGIASIDVGTQDSAAAAIDIIKSAINTVSSSRGDLGAIQNRLEHTISNLSVTTENMTAAESRIRDTDMASEMMEFTKNNILTQAAQSMLAQANQLPQGVLQLLQ